MSNIGGSGIAQRIKKRSLFSVFFDWRVLLPPVAIILILVLHLILPVHEHYRLKLLPYFRDFLVILLIVYGAAALLNLNPLLNARPLKAFNYHASVSQVLPALEHNAKAMTSVFSGQTRMLTSRYGMSLSRSQVSRIRSFNPSAGPPGAFLGACRRVRMWRLPILWRGSTASLTRKSGPI
jgi:hypothetical protein